MPSPAPPPGANFDPVAHEYDATRGGAERARRQARDLLPHLSPGTLLEIGVGTGIVAEEIRRAQPRCRLTGVDISAQMLRRAAGRLPGAVVRASAQQLPFQDGSFDGLVAVHVLHLVPDLAATLREAARVLRHGGRVVAVHGEPALPDDDLTGAMAGLRELGLRQDDSPATVHATGAAVGLRPVTQHPATPHATRTAPAELVGLIRRRTWSRLWALDDATWNAHVEPVLALLEALPDQHRPRHQESRMTVTVLQRD